MMVTLIHSYFIYCRALCLHLVTLHTLFTVIAHYFCIVELFIYCINNLHMYMTLYQAGMYQTALKKRFFQATLGIRTVAWSLAGPMWATYAQNNGGVLFDVPFRCRCVLSFKMWGYASTIAGSLLYICWYCIGSIVLVQETVDETLYYLLWCK